MLLAEETVDWFFQYLDATPKGTLTWFVIFDLEGPAINDVAVDATAYAHRDTLFWMQSYAINLLGPIGRTTKDFLEGIHEVLGNGRTGAYPGYVDPWLVDAQQAYLGANLPKLQQVKAEFDPGDVFHNPQECEAGRGRLGSSVHFQIHR
jgi:hypothetical protein